MNYELEKLANELIKNSKLKKYIKKFKLNKEIVMNNISLFFSYINQEVDPNSNDWFEIELDSFGIFQRVFINNEKDTSINNTFKNLVTKNYIDEFIFEKSDLFRPLDRKGLLAWVYKFKENIHFSKQNLILIGNNNSGKTFILKRLLYILLTNNQKVAYLNFNDFNNLYLKIKQDITNLCINADYLLIDDFGHGVTTFQLLENILIPIIIKRKLKNKPIFITTRFTRDQLINFLTISQNPYQVQRAKLIAQDLVNQIFNNAFVFNIKTLKNSQT